MPVPAKLAAFCAAFCLAAAGLHADEIRLKDGKKLYGVIVAYEDNMFRIKTDFGFVLVEKDKIASIVPTTAAAKPAKKTDQKPSLNPTEASSAKSPIASAATAHASDPSAAKPTISGEPVRPELPAT